MENDFVLLTVLNSAIHSLRPTRTFNLIIDSLLSCYNNKTFAHKLITIESGISCSPVDHLVPKASSACFHHSYPIIMNRNWKCNLTCLFISSHGVYRRRSGLW